MTELRSIDGAMVRIQTPPGPGPHRVVVMLHGLTGDEDVMWVFAGRLPQDALLIAPRGLYPTNVGGYGWQKTLTWGQAVGGLNDGVKFLERLLTRENFPTADLEQVSLVGFSQGAALAYLYGLTHPNRVAALAGLAGFFPVEARTLVQNRPFAGKSVFLAHGTEDKIVPFEKAVETKGLLEEAGAVVILCSDEVGHKLSANCFRGLEMYFRGMGSARDGAQAAGGIG